MTAADKPPLYVQPVHVAAIERIKAKPEEARTAEERRALSFAEAFTLVTPDRIPNLTTPLA